jgi:Fur family transcriptional regulator, zinc uptake regulator
MAVVNAHPPASRESAESLSREAEGDSSCACAKPIELTPSRQRVFDELRAAGAPLGAYELIDRVGARSGKRPAPISVYRALDFLVDRGLVHRLASRSAFLACSVRHASSDAVVFLICDDCGAVSETPSADIASNLSALAARSDFHADLSALELVGRCAECRNRSRPSPQDQ